MDIYIKSFNRIYYLDRCIYSIYKHVKGDFTIKVLDDGTPAVFLEKLQVKYPEISILKSPFYEKKSDAIVQHVLENKTYNVSGIPDDFWYEQLSTGSANLLLLEDDIWITRDIDINQVETMIEEYQLACIKLYWGNNEKIIQGKKKAIDASIELLTDIPFPIKSPGLFRFLMSKKTKLFALAGKLGIVPETFLLPYYSIYVVAGAFFKRDYWLHLWKNNGGSVNEPTQLYRALSYVKKNKVNVGKMVNEASSTSFITSTTNYYQDISLDFIKLNYYINEAWFHEELSAENNFPDDFDLQYLEKILKRYKVNSVDFESWNLWIARFKQQYRTLGFQIK